MSSEVTEMAQRPGPFVGGMTRSVWWWIREQIYAGVIAAGYEDLTPAHVSVFRYPTPDGLRPSELAEQLQITKQSVNDLLRQMEGLGYLRRDLDPVDGRARVVRLTDKGQRLEDVVYREARAAELRVADALGSRRFAQLHTALEQLTDRIARDDMPAPREE